MPVKTDKNILKQYFRSGSRPTQKQFYELIDNCYNENYTTFVPGYQLLIDRELENTIKSIRREAGNTILLPFFTRINTVHHRSYHYAVPLSNLSSGFLLEKIIMEMHLPKSAEYIVKDKSRDVHITQEVNVDYIKVYNGTEEIFNGLPDADNRDSSQEFLIKASTKLWKGISIDIAVVYDIKSDIAVSDQFDATAGKEQMLEHFFGGVGCIFKPVE